MKRIVARVSGRVIGVGFRDYVVDCAKAFAVAGTVRNAEPPGDYVEIDVEGEPADVDAFLSAVHRDARTPARVDSIARRDASPLGIRGFRRIASL